MKFSELRKMFRRQAELNDKLFNDASFKDEEERKILTTELIELNLEIDQILAKNKYLFMVDADTLIKAIKEGIYTLHSNDKYLTNFYCGDIDDKTWLIFEGRPTSSKNEETTAIGPIYHTRGRYMDLDLKYLLDHSQTRMNESRKVLSGLCPGIEDVLWAVVREQLNKERKSRMTYIQNMIAQNQDKISEINRPNYVKTETEKLEKENLHWQSELSSLNATIDNID